VKSAPGVPVPRGDVDLFAEPTFGRTQILTDQALCLSPASTFGSTVSVGQCSMDDEPVIAYDLSYLLVPVDAGPDRDSTQEDDHWFRVVSNVDYGQMCLSLQPGQSLYDAIGEVCDASDPSMMFRAIEAPDPVGIFLGWQSIVDLAVLGATGDCTATAANPDNPPYCLVAVKDHPTQWFDPRDKNIHQYGKLGTQLLGCGTAAGPDGSTFFHNDSSSPVTTSLTSSVSSTSSSTATTTYGSTTTLNASGGVKDVFSVSLNEAFSYSTSTVKASTQTQTTQSTVTETVKPGEYLMTAWSQEVYTLDGYWKFGVQIPETSGQGLDWTITASSNYPALTGNEENYGLVSAVTSAAVKSCTASPPSTSATKPTMTSDLTTCQDPSPAPASGEIGSWVYACPGTWDTPPGDDPAQQFSYQWSITAGGGAPLIPLDGADESGFRIEPSTSGGKTVYLRVAVAEAVTSPTSRLASDYVLSPDEVTVTPAVGAPVGTAPVRFVSRTPDALVGSPYSASLVAPSSGDVSAVTATGLPSGFQLSPDGTLSGTAATASESTITLTDEANGVSTTLGFSALEPHPDFLHGPEIIGVVGTPMTTRIVTDDSVFSTISVAEGALPSGLTLSADGTLSGTPMTSGRSRVVFASASGNRSAVDIILGDVPARFDTALPRGRAGEAYTAETVVQPGSRALYTFAGPEGAGKPEWATLDSSTGRVSGTPTKSGPVSLAVRNVLDPTAPAQAFIIDIDQSDSPAPTPSASTPSTPVAAGGPPTTPHGESAHLANTGSNPWAPLAGGLLLCAAGYALTLWRRSAVAE
jgi:hypothetical protein